MSITHRRFHLSKDSAPRLIVRATGATVLLVEDDHDIRVSIRSLLEDEGYNVLTVTNGRSALNVLQMTTPKPRLIILDLLLPVMDGWEFAEQVRQIPESADIPIVVTSGFRDRPPPSGTVGFLKKPVTGDALLRVVAEHCRNEVKAGVTQTGELPPLVPEDESTSEFTPWRTTHPREGEDVRWECVDGRWIAVSVGSGSELGTVQVTDSSGRSKVVDSYEGALALAKQWQRG